MSRSHREPSGAIGSHLKRGSNLLKHSPWLLGQQLLPQQPQLQRTLLFKANAMHTLVYLMRSKVSA